MGPLQHAEWRSCLSGPLRQYGLVEIAPGRNVGSARFRTGAAAFPRLVFERMEPLTGNRWPRLSPLRRSQERGAVPASRWGCGCPASGPRRLRRQAACHRGMPRRCPAPARRAGPGGSRRIGRCAASWQRLSGLAQGSTPSPRAGPRPLRQDAREKDPTDRPRWSTRPAAPSLVPHDAAPQAP